jgi:hypothetical protein
MDSKNWYASKSIWAGVIILVIAIAKQVGIDLPVETILTIATGLGIVGLRQAIN